MTKTGLAQEVREGPILMRPELVCATFDDVKTQTRRTRGLNEINREPDAWHFCDFNGYGNPVFTKDEITYKEIKNPFGWEGDRLWVREGWRWYGRIREPGMVEGGFEYRADGAHRKFTDFADPQDVWEQFKAAAVNEGLPLAAVHPHAPLGVAPHARDREPESRARAGHHGRRRKGGGYRLHAIDACHHLSPHVLRARLGRYQREEGAGLERQSVAVVHYLPPLPLPRKVLSLILESLEEAARLRRPLRWRALVALWRYLAEV
jgi:hypothetical protein